MIDNDSKLSLLGTLCYKMAVNDQYWERFDR